MHREQVQNATCDSAVSGVNKGALRLCIPEELRKVHCVLDRNSLGLTLWATTAKGPPEMCSRWDIYNIVIARDH